ncbi:MAG: DUF6785 family protein [Janthinobacterium lividum]
MPNIQAVPISPPLEPAKSNAHKGTTGRAFLVGIVCVALTCVLVTWAELVISTIRIGYLQLPPVSIALLIVVLGLTRGLSRLLKGRWAFTPPELATVYIMSVVAAMIASHGMAQKLLPLLAASNYFATSQNGWQKIFGEHIPRWLVPYDPMGAPKQAVTAWYYERLPRGESIPWHAWVTPLLVWGLFYGLVFFAFLCLTALLRRQWSDNEKLAFPLTQLPLEIIGEEGSRSFFADPKVWAGAAIPIAIYGIDWVHQIVPSFPTVTTSLLLNDYLTTPPWNQMAYTPLICSFAALGFFYLLPLDILFSLWFFFLLTRLEQVIGISFGMDMPHMPTTWLPVFEGYQIIGAYLVLAGSFVWIARPHLRRVWASVISKSRSADDASEMLSYRTAFWGLLGSLAALCVMMTLMGASWWVSVLEMVCVIFIIGLVMARSTAEAGMLMTETTFQPYDLYRMTGSLHSLGPANLTILAFVDHLLSHDQRGLLLTGMLDSARIGDKVKLHRRSLALAIVAAILCAVVIAVPLQLVLAYKIGALNMDGWMMQGSPLMQFRVNAASIQTGANGSAGDWQAPAFFLVGIAVALFLTVMRSRFFWWPLHPLGYALAGSQSTIEFWFPCLLAWMLKAMTLRYGGISFYRAVRPVFLGLILGEFSMAVLCSLANLFFHVPAPPFPWL